MTFAMSSSKRCACSVRMQPRDAGPFRHDSALPLAPHQVDAVERASEIIGRYRGVLLADATGLGKTRIAHALIERAMHASRKTVLVTGPASLRPHWAPYLRDLRRKAAALHPAEIGWVSHTRLSLGRWPAEFAEPGLVIVDEAHAFRNPTTRRYRALAGLCIGADVVLLTATPINNSLVDLLHLLRLFLARDALRDAGVPDLLDAFRSRTVNRGQDRRTAPAPPAPFLRVGDLDAGSSDLHRGERDFHGGKTHLHRVGNDLHHGENDRRFRSAIRRVTVRRTRRAIEGGIGGLRFPVRESPRSVSWDMDAGVPAFFERVGTAIEELRFDCFAAAGGSPAELLRFTLLKRLESSLPAFRSSLRSLREFLVAFVASAMDGWLLRARDHREAGGADGQLILAPLALDRMPRNVNRAALIDSASRDLDRIVAADEVVGQALAGDAKIGALIDLVDGPLRGRKTLIFTEYRDTAEYLWRSLAGRRVALIHGGGARLGGTAAGRSEVVGLFAPRSNRRPRPAEHLRVDILVATDLLAEGFNLQDAADVVSFDLPWNPVRLIQRVGRIDRLGSLHPTVRCHNFVPARQLDDMLGILDRLASKLAAIRAGIGGDTHVLELPHGGGIARVLRRVASGDARLVDDLEQDLLDPAGHAVEDSLPAGSQHGGERNSGAPTTRPADRPDHDSTGLAAPARNDGDPRPSPASRLADRLLSLLVRHPGGADTELCARADRVLARLDHGFRAGEEIELAELVGRIGTGAARPLRRRQAGIASAADLVAALESLLGEFDRRSPCHDEGRPG
jgi:Helicase conserved C-terminal domain/SNF2-related domain/Type III restriction enzyme, res subunit